MKRTIIILMFLLASMVVSAQEVAEKFVSHKISAIETDSGEPIASNVDMICPIVSAIIEDKEFLVISTDALTYTITIVEKKEEKSSDNVLTRTFYGFENMEGVGTYVATVFFFYDLSKNESVPDAIYLRIEGSPNILIFAGIIRIDE